MTRARPGAGAGPPGDPTRRSPIGGWTLVVASGEFDVGNTDVLEQVLRRAVSDDFPDRVLALDLHRVCFMDCAVLGVLVRTRNRLGPRFRLADPSPAALRLLDLSRMTAAFVVTFEPFNARDAASVHHVPTAEALDRGALM